MKQDSEIDAALREVAKHRDTRLGMRPTLSPARAAVLNDFLAREFPVEAVLHQIATKRDRLLDLHTGIPASAESILQRHLRVGMRNGPIWLRLFPFPWRAALTTCVLMVVAILCFMKWENPVARNAKDFPHALRLDGVNYDSEVALDRFPFGGAELFTRVVSIRSFDLNTNEPASLQASFQANSTLSFVDGNGRQLGLRLDLPERASFVEDSFTRTP